MATSASSSSSDTKPPQSILDRIAAALGVVLGIIRKMPMVFLFGALAIVLYYRNAQQPEFEVDKQFPGIGEVQSEPKPPADFPKGANAAVWSCVHVVDSKLSNGLWADVYYGMEVRLDGKVVTAKVTEKWQELSDDKRRTVAQLIVDTWIENGQSLKFLTSAADMEEVIIKRLPEDTTVATWKPSTGVLLSAPQTGA